MSDLFGGPTPPKLKAITINGSVQVESEADAKAREERRKQRKSRWDNSSKVAKPSTSLATAPSPRFPGQSQGQILALTGPGANSMKDNPMAVKARMPLQTSIDVSKMDNKQQDMYVLQMQIQEATRNLARPDLGIPINPRDRSPSPEPIYNSNGIRINTRKMRVKQRLTAQRNNAITKLKELDPSYQPPSQFKYKNTQLEDRVFIPADEHPEINFMGLLLGPRGNFLEKIKEETKCNIVIRGKGSLKTGMTGITKDGKQFLGLDEALNAHITVIKQP